MGGDYKGDGETRLPPKFYLGMQASVPQQLLLRVKKLDFFPFFPVIRHFLAHSKMLSLL